MASRVSGPYSANVLIKASTHSVNRPLFDRSTPLDSLVGLESRSPLFELHVPRHASSTRTGSPWHGHFSTTIVNSPKER